MSAEERRNIEFVKIIEKFPCLYDNTMADHDRRDVVEGAWNAVAHEALLSVSDAKERWKNLRSAFARSCKNSSPGISTRRKKYYLFDAIKFVLPFMKARGAHGTSSEEEPSEAAGVESPREAHEDANRTASDAQEGSGYAGEGAPDAEATPPPATPPPATPPPAKRDRGEVMPLQEHNRNVGVEDCVIEIVDARHPAAFAQPRGLQMQVPAVHDGANPPDAYQVFFTSLLPEINRLSARRRRKLKQLTLQALDRLLSEQEDEETENDDFRFYAANADTSSL